MATVELTRHERGRHDGRTSLIQEFQFTGVTADAIADVLMSAPLLGPGSIFGERPGEEVAAKDNARGMRGFSPVAGFRFDVDMTRRDRHLFVVRFSQPGRRNAYLNGDAVWSLIDADDGSLFDEQINTPAASRVGATPLSGSRPSLRRWLFFRVGHRQVMTGSTRNIASLVD